MDTLQNIKFEDALLTISQTISAFATTPSTNKEAKTEAILAIECTLGIFQSKIDGEQCSLNALKHQLQIVKLGLNSASEESK